MNAKTIPIAEIDVSGRVRDADTKTVQGYAMVAEKRVARGFSPLTQPIVIRPVDRGHKLIDGANRLAALKEIGRSEVVVGIDAIIREETDEAALDSELFANLANVGLKQLDRQLFLHKAWEANKERTGETRGRKSKVKQLQEDKKRESFALFSSKRFYEAVAERIGMSEKTVKEAVRIAKALIEADAVDEVRGTMLEDNLNELKQLAALPKEHRRAAASAIKSGQSKTVSDARVEIGLDKKKTDDPRARDYAKIIDLWGKLPRLDRATFLDALGVPEDIAKTILGREFGGSLPDARSRIRRGTSEPNRPPKKSIAQQTGDAQ